MTLPRIPTDWVVGAFAISEEKGLRATAEPPPRFSGTRRFYIELEYPELVTRGEQIGLRVAVFNYWTYWTEALVYLEGSPDYKFVSVQWRGSTVNYNPKTVSGEIHNVVYVCISVLLISY